MEKRSCPFCGKPIGAALARCPFCREAIPQLYQAPGSRSVPSNGQAYVRRGLLWALLAGVIYYFAGGHSGLNLPFEVPSFVTQYLVPLMFLAGVAMALYGLFLKLRS
jgi:hypothetical protein